jgi:hypothetical protein
MGGTATANGTVDAASRCHSARRPTRHQRNATPNPPSHATAVAGELINLARSSGLFPKAVCSPSPTRAIAIVSGTVPPLVRAPSVFARRGHGRQPAPATRSLSLPSPAPLSRKISLHRAPAFIAKTSICPLPRRGTVRGARSSSSSRFRPPGPAPLRACRAAGWRGGGGKRWNGQATTGRGPRRKERRAARRRGGSLLRSFPGGVVVWPGQESSAWRFSCTVAGWAAKAGTGGTVALRVGVAQCSMALGSDLPYPNLSGGSLWARQRQTARDRTVRGHAPSLPASKHVRPAGSGWFSSAETENSSPIQLATITGSILHQDFRIANNPVVNQG